MCFGMRCQYECGSGPGAGDCTLSDREIGEKCPQATPSLHPLFGEILDKHFPEQTQDKHDENPF